MNVWQRKIDDQRSVFQRVLPPKNALQTKRPVFYSPGEFTGRGSEAHLHKRKAEILRFRVKRELSSNLPPKRKKRPEDRSAENFENGRGERIPDFSICNTLISKGVVCCCTLSCVVHSVVQLLFLRLVEYNALSTKVKRK